MRACPQCFATYTVDIDYCGVDGTRLVEVEEDLLLGKVLDRYRVESVLGRGGMGSVYRATHVTLGREFALKVLSGELAANRTLITRFHREALALSKIRHTNIVGVVDFITTTTGLNVLIMEYLSGRTLADVIEKDGPMDYRRAARIARQIAAGLNEAHRMGIIHRDVKPSNVLLVAEGFQEVVKLLDFGVVAIDEEQAAEKLTGHGRILGTPTYMSPELVSQQPITPASDLYALGIIMYEMLTGNPPYEGTGVTDTLLKHVTDTAPKLTGAGGLEDLVDGLLIKDPNQRPSGALLVEELERLERRWAREVPLTGDVPRIARVDQSQPLPRTVSVAAAPRPPPGRSWTTIGLGVGFAASAAIASMLWFDGRNDPDANAAIVELGDRRSGGGAASTSTIATEEDVDDAVGPDGSRPRRPRKTGGTGSKGGRPQKGGDARSDHADVKVMNRVLEQRGLTLDDLDQHPRTSELYSKHANALWKRNDAEISRTAKELAEVAEKLPLERSILQRRLDRLHIKIRGAGRSIPPNLLNEIEQEYFALQAKLSDVSSDRAFTNLAKRIGQTEAKLRKYARGS